VNSIVLSGAPTVVPSGATLSCYQARNASVSHWQIYQSEISNSSNKEHLEGSNGLQPVHELNSETCMRLPHERG
jgi:hypothetical protein